MNSVSFDTFICANSKNGFVTFQQDLMSADNIGIIKGGPGTGKSTLMKKIADKYEGDGYAVERIHCSSDPQSLDGVYIREKSRVYFDGTSPHMQELPLPGVGCKFLDLGRFWNTNILSGRRDEIKKINVEIKELYIRAYRFLESAGRCDGICDFLAEPFFMRDKAERYINNLAAKLCPLKHGRGRNERRFLSAVSHCGRPDYSEMFAKKCDRIYEISDSSGLCAPYILDKLNTEANRRGYDTLRFYDPLTPEKCELLYIDGINFGIGKRIIDDPYLKINTLRFFDCGSLKEFRNRIRFYKKLRDQLTGDAVNVLGRIKELHDGLERIYIGGMDFEAVNEFTEDELKSL